ncbi:hypothetical protein Ancab_011081, partial [Ancistrocladus abbreviatus]
NARVLQHPPPAQRSRNESSQLLRELGFQNLLEGEQHRRVSTEGAGTDRVSPAGPDPQHHS